MSMASYWWVFCFRTKGGSGFGVMLRIFPEPSIVGAPSHKPPISFPYFKGFLWEWHGSSMGMEVPLLQVPREFLLIMPCRGNRKRF